MRKNSQKNPRIVLDYFSGDDWKVTVVTDTGEKSGTEAELLITIYGEKGHSEDLILKSDQGNKLLPGSTEQFDVSLFSSYDIIVARIP